MPSPVNVLKAFIFNFSQLAEHSAVSLAEAFLGLFIGVFLGFVFAVIMDKSESFYKMFYPLIIISQTIPVIAVAPLLVLWFGYGIAPKVVLIVLVCFFPMTIALLDAFRNVDNDVINLLKSMGATEIDIYKHVKLPWALPSVFSGLKISVSYAVVGAVIAEWLGGTKGLGVYMTKVRKSYSFDKMFAVILLISLISLMLIWLVAFMEKKAMPWKFLRKEESN